MQYQSSLQRDELVDLAINQYFGNVDRKELEAVLDCFHDNAMITVQTAFTVHDGKDNIRRMFVDFMGAWKTIIHKDFTCTVDEKNGRITACFTAELEDGTIMGLRHRDYPIEGVQFHPESIRSEHGHALLKNFLARVAGADAGAVPA